MSTKSIDAVLNDYRDRMTDSLDTELSRAQREADERNLKLVTEALAELESIRRAAKGISILGGVQQGSEAMNLMETIAKETP